MMQLMTMCDYLVNHNCMLLIGIRFVEDKWPKWQSDQLAGHPSLSTLEKLKIKKTLCTMCVCVCVHIRIHAWGYRRSEGEQYYYYHTFQ